ncbi:hypothetical protein GCM10010439_23970 [Actinocorallia aurantiaca]|uniref:RING-type E3 ubiquitin transferase n=1 Tax=Actinocorallia aurantiaca TaxID=46204 RepID=A0ABP6GJV0_9ACTN
MLETVVLLAGTKDRYNPETGPYAFAAVEIVLVGLTFGLVRLAKVFCWDDWLMVRGRLVHVADLPDVRPWRRIALTGTAAAGPDGILRAPLSEEPCVWWSVTTHESGPRAVAGERQECSEGSFTLEDATGGVVIPIGEDGIRGSTRSLRQESADEDRPGVRIVRQERIIPEGARLQFNGTPLADEDGRPVFPGYETRIATVELAHHWRHGWFKGLLLVAAAIPFHAAAITVLVISIRDF